MTQLRRGASPDQKWLYLVEQMARQQSDMGHLVAHDVRGPMSVLQSALGFISKAPTRDAEELIATCQDAVASAITMLHNLDFVVTDEVACRSDVPVEFGRIVTSAAESLGPSFPLRELKFERFIEPGDFPVNGREDYLRLLVENLLRFASEGAPMGSTVEFHVGRSGEQVFVETRDLGPSTGAPLGELLYSDFSVSELRAQGVRTGRCCGLAVLSTIAAELEGSASVVRENEYHVVRVSLPLASVNELSA